MRVKFAIRAIVVPAASMALAACGSDGGGGVASTTAPPAAPTNASLASLVASQSFPNDATTHSATFNLSTSQTISGSSAKSALTIQYDLASNTYTLTTQGRSQSFAATDITSNANGQAVFKKTTGSTLDYLTLQAATFGGTGGAKYVGLGFWQRNGVSGTTQNTSFDIFTYGLDTPASAVPRTGQAALATYVFGLTTTPGYEPASFSGTGRFDIDFQRGLFSTATSVTESALVTGAGATGGGVQLTGSGTLSSTDGTLSGLVNYSGLHANATGTLSGRLYGPNGQEVGASFTANGADGSAASGSLIGYAPTTALTPVNLSLVNLVTNQLYYTLADTLYASHGNATPAYYTSTGADHLQLTQTPDGSLLVPNNYALPSYQYTAADKISGSANFTTYQKTVNGQTATTEVYNSGSANTELALTYASFAHVFDGATNSNSVQQTYEVFGLATGYDLLSARTGTAHYSGVAYGAAGNSSTGASYAVTGTSSYDVNFGSQTYTGALNLSGSGSTGSVNYGGFNFAGTMVRGQGVTGALNQGTIAVGTITTQFYGPTGQEIGGPFQLTMPAGSANAGTSIVGASLAKGG
ncbi:transferrin-binding protein-like solute binding protein [Novosphingobium terrae]|uniref:transferrin-binding protein-like solute binding protein n=1 Tax=Novosphingobium terrae TaxID=2726189 RepID=UPI001F130EC6|nr:transferrin-binding protein-like solute binding protein [Novosphingobium terrae]